ncbi:transposase [Planctomycetaceae bacterium SH139]
MNTKNFASAARVSRLERTQVEMRLHSLDEKLPADHRARLLWTYVESLDLSLPYGQIKVTRVTAVRNAIAPEILVALWMLATLDGIGSARELGRRCDTDFAYMWICYGVGVNRHSLSDFRAQQVEFLETLLVDSVAALIDQGLVPLETIAQDGMRVRASAGSSSFRRKPTLEELQQEATRHLEELKRQNANESERQIVDARKTAAKQRAAKERAERIAEAIRQHQALSEQREIRKKGDGEKTRVSTTDRAIRQTRQRSSLATKR